MYREAFESILFYVALWNRDNGMALMAGLGAGIAVLAAVAAGLLGYSKRLPIARFFKWSSVLIAILAVVLVGKGVAALQEAGWLATHPVDFWRLPGLGIFPSAQPLAAQVIVVLLILASFARNYYTAKREMVKR